MADSTFDADIERVRLAATRKLPASCQDDFQRLSRTLVYGPKFQWLLVDVPDESLRKQVMAALDEVLRAADLSSNRLPLSDKIADVATLEARLVKNAQAAAVVHVIGRPGWFTAARWDAFNVRRERLAAEAQARLVFWLDADAIALASRGAPDLWAWRGGVYAFVSSGANLRAPSAVLVATGSPGNGAPLPWQTFSPDNRSQDERLQRIAEIRSWLAQTPAPPDELLVAPIDELGRLLYGLGDFDAALQHWRTVELPFFERLGDVRSRAVTMGQIADILQARGQLDEALRIRQEEQLPVYEQLGDVRSRAVTMGKVADILQARGQLDEALRIRQEEELPVYEHLGDVYLKAVTMGQIADILQVRGQLDEALRIRQKEELPVYERLGDVGSRAVTMGKVADILQARGQLDEALTLHAQRLPVARNMGYTDDVAHVLFAMAQIQLMRGDHQRHGLQAIRANLSEAFAISLKSQRVEAVATIGQLLAQVLAMDGETKQALKVLDQAEAAYEKLGRQQDIDKVQQLRQQIELQAPNAS